MSAVEGCPLRGVQLTCICLDMHALPSEGLLWEVLDNTPEIHLISTCLSHRPTSRGRWISASGLHPITAPSGPMWYCLETRRLSINGTGSSDTPERYTTLEIVRLIYSAKGSESVSSTVCVSCWLLECRGAAIYVNHQGFLHHGSRCASLACHGLVLLFSVSFQSPGGNHGAWLLPGIVSLFLG